jgi:hypothetical protein
MIISKAYLVSWRRAVSLGHRTLTTSVYPQFFTPDVLEKISQRLRSSPRITLKRDPNVAARRAAVLIPLMNRYERYNLGGNTIACR